MGSPQLHIFFRCINPDFHLIIWLGVEIWVSINPWLSPLHGCFGWQTIGFYLECFFNISHTRLRAGVLSQDQPGLFLVSGQENSLLSPPPCSPPVAILPSFIGFIYCMQNSRVSAHQMDFSSLWINPSGCSILRLFRQPCDSLRDLIGTERAIARLADQEDHHLDQARRVSLPTGRDSTAAAFAGCRDRRLSG